MRYGSVCSGIEAATVAWETLGWKASWFAEIEKFPAAVLAARWPEVANLGDMTKISAAYAPMKLKLLTCWLAVRLARHSVLLACVTGSLMHAGN